MVRWVPVLPAAAVFLSIGCGRAGFEVALTPPADPSWGDGGLGDLEVGGTGETINTCHAVESAESTTVLLETGTVPPGTMVIVWQVQDAVATISTSAEIAVGTTGRWERRRVSESVSNLLTLSPALDATYSSGGAKRAQLCTIPEYEHVRILEGASLAAVPWNGEYGGFVGFLARDEVRIDGTIDAAGKGFRGTPPLGSGGGSNETALVNNVDQAGGIGEGIDASLANLAGRGNAANGGGGGGAFNAGGGGGGNGGRGGRGASQAEGVGMDDCSGYGGAALGGADGRFAFGGGGGSGHQDQELAGAGGDGGGVIWVRAYILRGDGTFDASGRNGEDSDIDGTISDGAGGGGAGGTILVESGTWDFDGIVRAAGGDGGSVDRPLRRGLGGGGGGGRAALPSGVSLVPDLGGGDSGQNGDSSSLDAEPGEPTQ